MVEAQTHIYDAKFFDYLEIGGRRSAERVIGLVLRYLPVSSVLDVGCGRGVWIDEWRRAGVEDALGVDGAYVDADRLAVPAKHMAAFDLSLPFRLERRFDFVQSLEVGEHIPASKADVFVDNLVAHGDTIMFSAAVPGQGGEFHVNEQSYEYWRDKFAVRGFVLFDFIRPHIAKDRRVEPWYRYNTLLFVHKDALEKIPAMVRSHEVREQEPIPNFAPPLWRLRNSILGRLPQPLVQRIARLKHAAVRAGLPVPN
ncbi:MAG: methyltransferase domain-containing protein [Beijerinckiaceae bacterium]